MATTNKKDKTKDVKRSCLWGMLLLTVLILVDQITKALADAYQPDVDIIKGWLRITIVYNPGISYGWGAQAPEWVKIMMVVITGIMMIALLIIYFKTNVNRTLMRLALIFIVGGGLGNLIDRVYYKVWTLDNNTANMLQQGVRDMVDLSRFGFAVCNFADFFITAGAIMLVLSFVFFDKEALFPVGKYKLMRDKEKEEEEKVGNALNKSMKADEEKK